MRRKGWKLPAAASLVAALGACTSTTDTTTASSAVQTTSLAVRPVDFLGSVVCTNQAGGMRSFVATATDVTDPDHPLTLPSSGPTPCSQAVLFRYIVVGHIYTAEVDGYEELADALAPTADPSSGSRHMVLRGGDPGKVVSPRWTTDCGIQGVRALDDESVPMQSCDALVDHRPGSSLTQITLDPAATLGALRCSGAEGGNIFAFDVLPKSASLAPQAGVACGAAPLTWTEGVTADTTYDFELRGYAVTDLDTPSYAATCQVRARAGLSTLADCSLLALE